MICAVLVALWLLFAPAAAAQVFSPGPLSQAHAELDALPRCVECHGGDAGGAPSDARCTTCHVEIATRQQRNSGYHARVRGTPCASCHVEHRGRSAALVTFSPSQERFDHRLTGMPLVGVHQQTSCRTCHEPRSIVDEDIRALLSTTASSSRQTFLGLSSQCVSCHFDEHRGQLGASCERCHTPSHFGRTPVAQTRVDRRRAEAATFDHNSMSAFALTGRHQLVDCTACHELVADTHTAADAFPAPRDPGAYRRYVDIPHEGCIDCHVDHHDGRVGPRCADCHTTAGWQQHREPADRRFHDDTGFPLKGQHASTSCRACHGPFGRGASHSPARFRGLPHARCTDCHLDGHQGALSARNDTPPRCERCHDEQGFSPSRFTRAMHEATGFVLDGGHAAVGCVQCHQTAPPSPARVAAPLLTELLRQQRPLRLSTFQLPPAATRMTTSVSWRGVAQGQAVLNCRACHADQHQGQFVFAAPEANQTTTTVRDDGVVLRSDCRSCHVPPTTTFRTAVVNHDDSRFPLTGAHHTVPCASCHQQERQPDGSTRTRYRPVDVRCVACHDDVHTGQLARDGSTDCARCHETTRFVPATRFSHDDSRFPLVGRHAQVACATCHATFTHNGVRSARYVPLPRECAGCHVDEHAGRFDVRFAPTEAP